MALSDTLFEAELEIVQYIIGDRYSPEVRAKAESILEEMDALRLTPGLDTPPYQEAPPRRTANEIIRFFSEITL